MNLTYGNINKFAKLSTPTPQGMSSTLPAENDRSLAYGKISKMMQQPKPTPNMGGENKEKKEHGAERELENSMIQHTMLHALGLSQFAIFLEIGEKIGETLDDLKEMKLKAQMADNEIAMGNQQNLSFSRKMSSALTIEEDSKKDKKKRNTISYGNSKMKMY